MDELGETEILLCVYFLLTEPRLSHVRMKKWFLLAQAHEHAEGDYSLNHYELMNTYIQLLNCAVIFVPTTAFLIHIFNSLSPTKHNENRSQRKSGK